MGNVHGDEKQGPTTKATYPARLSFKIKGEIRIFPDKKKLKELIDTMPVLQQMLNGLL